MYPRVPFYGSTRVFSALLVRVDCKLRVSPAYRFRKECFFSEYVSCALRGGSQQNVTRALSRTS